MSKKKIREAFRTAVFTRDQNKCRKCDNTNDLDAHHITDRNKMLYGGYVIENGISLCPECHLKAEVYHHSKGKSFVIGYHPDDLYKLIDSSYYKAVVESDKLSYKIT